MAALNVKTRLSALFFYAKRPGVLLGAPAAGPTAKSGSDTFTLSETPFTISASSTDSATLSSTASVVALTSTAVSSSDSFVFTDQAATAQISDVEILNLTETQSITIITLTAKSSSDSATFTDSGVVTVPVLPVSSDSFTFTDAGSVVALTDSNIRDSDSALLTESYHLTALISSSDSFTFTESSSNVVATPARRHIRSLI